MDVNRWNTLLYAPFVVVVALGTRAFLKGGKLSHSFVDEHYTQRMHRCRLDQPVNRRLVAYSTNVPVKHKMERQAM